MGTGNAKPRKPCPHCGSLIWSTDHVCMYCGRELPREDLTRGPSPEPEGVAGAPAGDEAEQGQEAKVKGVGAGEGSRDAAQSPGRGRVELPRRAAAEPGTQWFVRRTTADDGTIYGPYDEQVVRQMLRDGGLSWDDQVSREGSRNWRAVRRVPEFVREATAGRAAGRAPRRRASAERARAAQVLQAGRRNNVVAAVLALLLGSLGAHKFYNGSHGWGLLYLLLAWTSFPWLVAVAEGVWYLLDAGRYDARYNDAPAGPWKW